MNYSGIKKALDVYATENTTEDTAIRTSYSRIADSLALSIAQEEKWDKVANGDIPADSLEMSINALTDATLKASLLAELILLRADRAARVDMLTALDTAVETAGLMLI